MLRVSNQQRSPISQEPSEYLDVILLDATSNSLAVLISIVAHTFLAAAMLVLRPVIEHKVAQPVSVKITTAEKAKAIHATPKPESPAALPSPKKKPTPKDVTSEQQPTAGPAESAKSIQELASNALSQDATATTAPIGNTLMVEDDLSADASLIASSIVVPKYTDDAVDANVEASVAVDVFVDTQGNVTDAEIKKRVGYGMDERILASARHAKFHPRKDRFGRAVTGWTEIKFRLEIPN